MALLPGTLVGPYEITSQLGAGGMGEVYRAKDSRLKREVAIKVLPVDVANDAERLARFQREAEVLASLNHPNIAHVYGIEHPPESGHHAAGLVMELVEGEDLSQRIARGAIPIDEALPIAKQIAEALEAAHDAGIIHRDLKPGNIKVRDDGTVKVLDFGLAKALDPVTTVPTLANSPTITSPAMTMRGVILGTAAYMAPEQAKGKAVDKRADIWAFGCVLYEMLTGRRTFDGEDVTDTIVAVMSKEPDWTRLLATTPPHLIRVMRRCLEKDSRRRFRDIGDVRLEIEDGSRDVAVRSQSGSAGAHDRIRMIAPWAVAATLAVALAFTAIPRAPRPTAAAGDVMRFELTVPEGFMRIGTRAATMSLSNDGRRLAFMAVNSTNRPALFVREMSSLVPKVIQLAPSTLAWPSWSPDGRYLVVTVVGGFGGPEPEIGQGGVVRRIDPSGGPATTLAESGRSPIWGSAGAIVYAGKDGRLYRVPETGGPSTAVTELDAEAGELIHTPSSFLPDGRRFIFMAHNRDADESAMFVASIDGGPRSKLEVPATRVVYAGEWLWYIAGRMLMAQRIDAATARPEGGPISIADAVANFAVSPSGALVIVPSDGGSVKMAWLDREGVAGPPVAEPGNYSGLFRPDLSPNGARMAFVRPDANGVPDVWQVDLERNVSTRVTTSASSEDAVVYSPDGKYLVFSSNRNGTADLYRRAADGSGSDELLFASPIRKGPTGISPDGTVLLFTQSGTETGPDIWGLPLTGVRTPKPLVVTPAFEGNAQFSPDGRWIAYCAGGLGDPDQVFVEPYPPTGARTRLSTTQGSSPRWSASGREIYYGTPTGQVMRVAVTLAAGSVRAGVPEAVLVAPELFSHNALVLDARSRILALSPDQNRRREPATVILNWPSLVAPQ